MTHLGGQFKKLDNNKLKSSTVAYFDSPLFLVKSYLSKSTFVYYYTILYSKQSEECIGITMCFFLFFV